MIATGEALIHFGDLVLGWPKLLQLQDLETDLVEPRLDRFEVT